MNRKINFEERKKIQDYLDRGFSLTFIGQKLGYNCATILRETYRCTGKYNADEAQKNVEEVKKKKFGRTYKRNLPTECYDDVLKMKQKEWSSKYNLNPSLYFSVKNQKIKQLNERENLPQTKLNDTQDLQNRIAVLEQQMQTIFTIIKEM